MISDIELLQFAHAQIAALVDKMFLGNFVEFGKVSLENFKPLWSY